MSYHCDCLKKFEKENTVQISFNLVFTYKKSGYIRRASYDKAIHCPFCGKPLVPVGKKQRS